MLKILLGLCQAAILAGMTALAPYAAGRCVLGVSPMQGVAMHGGRAMGEPGGRAAEAGLGTVAAASATRPQASDHTPASPHRHHGCCGCLGPCAGFWSAAPPASAAAAHVAAADHVAPWAAIATRPALPDRHLLPFANGPPSHLG